jgi:predicted dehydrogenase
MKSVGVAIIGAGAIVLGNHLPGLRLHPAARVAALCDSSQPTLENAARKTGVERLYTDFHEAIAQADVDAVIVATPNYLHPEIVRAAVAAGKHVLCEKPLALNLPDALTMYHEAERAGVRHMTAFTYRFVPAMRYMKFLVDRGDIGRIYHFRAQRFQDWGERGLGWRQVKRLAGTGEMADMLSHRIDYGHYLIGRIERLVADLRTFVPQRGGQVSDVDDWVAMICEFEAPAALAPVAPSGVLESTKLASGRGEGHRGQDTVEVNGAEGSIVYSTQKPLELRIGRRGDEDLKTIEVPREFQVWPGCPRDPQAGDPLVSFRYDQDFEFIEAIVQARPCAVTFRDGAAAQAVMQAAEESCAQRRWMEVERV